MKYTVVMLQAARADVREALKNDLVANGGVSEKAAQKLAEKGPGRLFKPTSQKKAERIFNIFRNHGAEVRLDEVPEVQEVTSLSALGGASEPSQDNAAFEAMFGGGAAGFGAAETTAANGAALGVGQSGAADDDWASFAGGLSESGAASSADDDWASFASLRIDVPEDTNPMNVTSMPTPRADLLDVANRATIVTEPVEERTAEQFLHEKFGPRKSLQQQLTLSALLPLGLLALVSLITVATALPKQQEKAAMNTARTVAESFGASVDLSSDAAVMRGLERLVATPDVSFAQVVLPSGKLLFASDIGTHKDTTPEMKTLMGDFKTWNEVQPLRQGVFSSVATEGKGKQKYAIGQAASELNISVATTPKGDLSLLLPLLLASLAVIGGAFWWIGRNLDALFSALRSMSETFKSIGKGQLQESSVEITSNDEIGHLLFDLEEMRVNVNRAFRRANRRG